MTGEQFEHLESTPTVDPTHRDETLHGPERTAEIEDSPSIAPTVVANAATPYDALAPDSQINI